MGKWLAVVACWIMTEKIIRLPLDTVLLMISELLPKVHNIQSTTNKASVTVAILDFLRSVSLQDVFPQSQSPPCRRFMVSALDGWFMTMLTRWLVDRCIINMVDIANMGRNLCAWHDTTGYMECHECATLPHQTYSIAKSANNGCYVTCCRRHRRFTRKTEQHG